MTETPIVERALQLAEAGECRDLAEIERKLAAEGYMSISAHLSGSSFRRQLRQLIRSSAASPPGGVSSADSDAIPERQSWNVRTAAGFARCGRSASSTPP